MSRAVVRPGPASSARSAVAGRLGALPGTLGDDSLHGAARDIASCLAGGGVVWCMAADGPRASQRAASRLAIWPESDPSGRLAPVPVDDASTAALRLAVRPGDSLVAIGRGDDRRLLSLMRRGGPWGVGTVLLCEGPSPAPGWVDRVVLTGPGGDGAGTHALDLLGPLVLEALGEHEPGAVRSTGCDEDVCTTCSDEGRLAEVLGSGGGGRARVLVAGTVDEVDVSLVRPVAPGDLLLVHAGVALSLLEQDLR